MLKKLFSLFAALTLGVGLWADGSVFTYTATQKLEYKFSQLGTVATHEFNEGNGRVTYEGTVTEIGRMAFDECSALLSITIPEGVTTIGEYAFQWCESLQSVTLPTSLTTIGDFAFQMCTDLQSIAIPAGVATIGTYAFAYCSSLASVTLSPGVTTIGEKAFDTCSSLQSITIPASVTTIGRLAFSSCSGLQSVTLSEGLTTIGEGAFAATGLTSVTIPASVTEIVSTAFYNCSALASVTFLGNACQDAIGNNTFYNVGSTTPATLVLPANWTGTKPNALGYWYGGKFTLAAPTKTSVITYTATEKLAEAHSTYEAGVHFNAFDKDIISHIYDPITQTGTITFDGELTEIGDNAFYNIKKQLLSIEIPATVTKIGEEAFYNNYALTGINLPEGLTEIGDAAFYYCESLKSVILPSTLTTIGAYAFRGCSALETIHIPASVVSFGSEVFVRCSALKSITVDSENPILSAVDGVLYSHNQDTLYIFPAADALERTEFTTPATVTYVGAGAFFKNLKLTSITIGNSVLKLGEDIIDGANALTVLKIGSSVTELESYCLENTITLDSVICYAVTPPTCGTYAVVSMHSGTNIYVPNSSVEAYKAADEWSSRADYIFPLTSPTGLIKVDNGASEHSDKCTMHDGKFFRNGQFVIVKDGKKINALGF